MMRSCLSVPISCSTIRRIGRGAEARCLAVVGVQPEQLAFAVQQLFEALVDRVLGQQSVDPHHPCLAHPVRAPDRLVLGRRFELRFSDHDHRGDLNVEALVGLC